MSLMVVYDQNFADDVVYIINNLQLCGCCKGLKVYITI